MLTENPTKYVFAAYFESTEALTLVCVSIQWCMLYFILAAVIRIRRWLSLDSRWSWQTIHKAGPRIGWLEWVLYESPHCLLCKHMSAFTVQLITPTGGQPSPAKFSSSAAWIRAIAYLLTASLIPGSPTPFQLHTASIFLNKIRYCLLHF